MKKSKLFIAFLAGLMSLTVMASNTTPVHRPLIEEYTGTWCGWCVRGLVGMELLRDAFGDEFIGVAYHDGDPMQITTSYPNSVPGYPSAYINRTYQVDPFYGSGDTSGGIVSEMRRYATLETSAGIDVTAQWTSADKTAIDVNVTSYFTSDYSNANFAIEVMLIADDLYGTGSTWNQANYYSNYAYYYADDPYLGPWTKKPASVSGIHFNDVLVGFSGAIANSLPSSIVAYDDYTTSYTFQLNRLPKPALIQNKDNLHVIAVVVYKNNRKAINANRCYISDFVEVTPGDVNNDGKISIDDVTALIDMLLSNSGTNDNADVNGDGKVSIDDVTALIDILLNPAR